MPLTDPELDLLLELLEDDPSDDVFVQVGEELVRRSRWVEAESVLKAGLAASPGEDEAWPLLARAALETGAWATALEACANVAVPSEEVERVRILALERSGRIDEARAAVDAFLADHPGSDVVIEAVRERIDAPPPEASRSAADPFLTVQLAERYVAIGRVDRAIRVYRRILYRHPADASLRGRLLQLAHADADLPEDLSEELADPNLVPPDLKMPQPAIGSRSVEPAPMRQEVPTAAMREAFTAPVHAAGSSGSTRLAAAGNPAAFERLDKPSGLADFLANVREAERGALIDDPDDDTDDITEPLPGLAAMGIPTPKRRKKRSLLKR